MARFRSSKWFLICALLLLAVIALPTAVMPVYADETVAAVRTKSNGNPYYIMVNRQMNTVTVYKVGSDGYYSVPYKAMVCSCGRSGHATPAGTFRTPDSRYVWRLMVDGSYGHYASRIQGSILFHSACYTSASSSKLMTDEYNMLGNNASLGCVRLQVADAKWIYDNVATGTYVTVYDSSYPGALGKPAKAVDNISNSPYKNWDPTDPASANPWRFRIDAAANGPGTVSGAGDFRYGAMAALKASPSANARFDGWYDSGGNFLTGEAILYRTVEREASYTAKFTQMVTVNAFASRSGSASGGGSFPIGTTVTVTANTGGEAKFLGWYDIYGNQLTSRASYTDPVWGNRDLYAMYEGDIFGDIPAGAWYIQDVTDAFKAGITNGISPILFGPQNSFTRAMAVQMLARVDQQIEKEKQEAAPESAGSGSADNNAEAAPESAALQSVTFEDVPADAWYAEAVNWAASEGIVNGVGDGQFAPDATITRAQMVTILGRYLERCGKLNGEYPEGLAAADGDQVPDYALDWFIKAEAVGLVKGYEDGTVRPMQAITRAEGAALMMRTKKLFAE
ncbi:MAG: S-layer homology domain-containing protein [Firmicutes bacterium]|nr:S-layer homology domain-containing protein [Bacillota bacterium]